jgi:hypothetical protein
MVRDGSVYLHLLIPSRDFITFTSFFELLLVHGHTSVQCLISSHFSWLMFKCIWAQTPSCLFMSCFLPLLVRPVCCVPLPHPVVYSVCICCLFLFVIFLSLEVCLVMPDLVVLLFRFQSLLSDLSSTATGTLLLR